MISQRKRLRSQIGAQQKPSRTFPSIMCRLENTVVNSSTALASPSIESKSLLVIGEVSIGKTKLCVKQKTAQNVLDLCQVLLTGDLQRCLAVLWLLLPLKISA